MRGHTAWQKRLTKVSPCFVVDVAIPTYLGAGAEVGEAAKLIDLQREHLDEYHQLTRAEKRDLIESFKDERHSRKMGVRVNPRGRQADVNKTCEKIEDLVSQGLDTDATLLTRRCRL